jgi:hypothetical protein
LAQNSFPMKEWHVEHMEKTIVKFVKGLPRNATNYQKRQHKRYCGLTNICRQIDYDLKHGATTEQVLIVLQKIRNDSSYVDILNSEGSMERLDELERHFLHYNENIYSVNLRTF